MAIRHALAQRRPRQQIDGAPGEQDHQAQAQADLEDQRSQRQFTGIFRGAVLLPQRVIHDRHGFDHRGSRITFRRNSSPHQPTEQNAEGGDNDGQHPLPA